MRARLDELADVPVWSMTPGEQRSVLADLSRARAQLDGLWLRVLAAADANDVAAETAATSTAAWLATAIRRTRSAAHADVRLAQAVTDDRHAGVLAALTAGRVDLDQARVVVRSVDALPADVDAMDRELAEKHLVTLAEDHDAAALKVLGRRVLEVLDPDAAELEDGRRLATEEAAAARTTYLQLCDNGDGSHGGRFRIPTLHAAMLATALQAFGQPAPSRPTAASPAAPPPRAAGSGVLRAAGTAARRPAPRHRWGVGDRRGDPGLRPPAVRPRCRTAGHRPRDLRG